jgi:2-iminobutanoate/2-iminopropanoate deaminase
MEVLVTKRRIATEGAPAALAVYSQAIEANGFVFCAGQLGLDPISGELVEGGVQAQTERALKNLGAVLDAAGLSYADVVKTTCFLADIGDFPAFNEVYARFFQDAPPARSTFAVGALPRGGSIEVEAIAAVREV